MKTALCKSSGRRRPSVLLAILAVIVFMQAQARVAWTQASSAEITGLIEDGTGAALPGADVVLVSTDSGSTRQLRSDASGEFLVPSLDPGHYKMTVKAPGFEVLVTSDIVLTVGEHKSLTLTLKPGAATETVQVNAGAEAINTTTADLSQVVGENEVKDLPLNGRDPSSLVLLSPGMTNVLNAAGSISGGYSFPTESGASANGGRQGSTYYLLDGVPNMDTYYLLDAPFPNADATQEFRVITNNFDAQYGFSPGAVVSIQTKSGSNQFHGGAFEFIRNNDLNAGNYFSHAVDGLKRNQFGVYAGGPILRNKLFIFGNYQGTRASTQAATTVSYTPTQAMLNGDFSAVPLTLPAPFVNNKIDPSQFNQAALTIAKTALPVGQNAQSGMVTFASAPEKQTYNEGTGRIDWNMTGKQKLAVRSFIDVYQMPAGTVDGNILATNNGSLLQYYNEMANHVWTISPSILNQISVFWTQLGAHTAAQQLDSSGQPVCMSRYINVQSPPGSCYMEGFYVENGFLSPYTEPSQELRTTYGLWESFNVLLGKHYASFGAQVFHQYAQEDTQYPAVPITYFLNYYTGFGLADYLMGDVTEFIQGAGEIASVKGWQYGVYAQDQYRLRPNLTLTAGLRWDPNTPPAVAGGRGAAFRPGQQSTMFPNAPLGLVFPGDAGISDALMPSSYNYFEPRIGIAWQPASLPNTSLRGAFGMFTSPLPYSYYNHTADISPFSPTYTVVEYPYANTFSNPWSTFAGTNYTSPFPPFASVSYVPPRNAPFQTPLTVQAIFDKNFKLGMTETWNASVQQKLPGSVVMQLAYVGSESYHQSVWLDQNPAVNSVRPLADFGAINNIASWATATYHALEASLRKQLTHGLQFNSSFTWSKTIDVASSGNPSGGGQMLGDPFSPRWNRGISNLNVPLVSVTNFVYETPALKGSNALVKNAFGSWELSGIWTLESGLPFSIQGGDGDDNSGSLQLEDRADRVPGQPLYPSTNSRTQRLNEWFNTAAFTVNAPGTFGDSGRNLLSGPGINTADLGLIKNWLFKERYGIQFRWEMFNAFNHPTFGLPNTDPSPGNTLYGQITTIGNVPPRVMQGALKLSF